MRKKNGERHRKELCLPFCVVTYNHGICARMFSAKRYVAKFVLIPGLLYQLALAFLLKSSYNVLVKRRVYDIFDPCQFIGFIISFNIPITKYPIKPETSLHIVRSKSTLQVSIEIDCIRFYNFSQAPLTIHLNSQRFSYLISHRFNQFCCHYYVLKKLHFPSNL